MRAALIAAVLSLLVAELAGCGKKPDGSLIYGFRTNDYELEFDGTQKTTTVGPGFVLMTRVPEDVRIADGRLQVGPREYGDVALKDRISVVAGKVKVNGQERRPLTH